MRKSLILLTAALLAGGCMTPVPESAERMQARALMVEELQSGGEVPDQVANEAATCALDRLSDAQVTELLAAQNDDERGEVMNAMSDEEGFLACIIGAGAFNPSL